MSNEYHSILVKKLNSKLSQEELTDLLYEVGETHDPIFIHPLKELYKAHRSSIFSHIIIHIIGQIDSPRKIDIAKEILISKETKNGDLMYALNILEKTRHYDDESLNILKKKLSKVMKDKNFTMRDFFIRDILSYFANAGRLNEIDKELQKVFRDPTFDSKTIELSLKSWILNSPSERIAYLARNYSKFKKLTKLEDALAKIPSQIDRKYSETLTQTIYSYGSIEAKSILQFHQNSLPVRDIVTIKDKINYDSRQGVIGQDIFSRDKNFEKQLTPASSRKEFESICISLRATLKSFNPLLKFHGLSDEEVSRILKISNTEDCKKSINSAQLYLYSKGIIVSEEFSHLRKLNRLLSIILHPEDSEKLKHLLKDFHLSNEYESQDWEGIHYKILEVYLEILKSISKKIEHP